LDSNLSEVSGKQQLSSTSSSNSNQKIINNKTDLEREIQDLKVISVSIGFLKYIKSFSLKLVYVESLFTKGKLGYTVNVKDDQNYKLLFVKTVNRIIGQQHEFVCC
jgi:hypothetical protein